VLKFNITKIKITQTKMISKNFIYLDGPGRRGTDGMIPRRDYAFAGGPSFEEVTTPEKEFNPPKGLDSNIAEEYASIAEGYMKRDQLEAREAEYGVAKNLDLYFDGGRHEGVALSIKKHLIQNGASERVAKSVALRLSSNLGFYMDIDHPQAGDAIHIVFSTIGNADGARVVVNRLAEDVNGQKYTKRLILRHAVLGSVEGGVPKEGLSAHTQKVVRRNNLSNETAKGVFEGLTADKEANMRRIGKEGPVYKYYAQLILGRFPLRNFYKFYNKHVRMLLRNPRTKYAQQLFAELPALKRHGLHRRIENLSNAKKEALAAAMTNVLDVIINGDGFKTIEAVESAIKNGEVVEEAPKRRNGIRRVGPVQERAAVQEPVAEELTTEEETLPLPDPLLSLEEEKEESGEGGDADLVDLVPLDPAGELPEGDSDTVDGEGDTDDVDAEDEGEEDPELLPVQDYPLVPDLPAEEEAKPEEQKPPVTRRESARRTTQRLAQNEQGRGLLNRVEEGGRGRVGGSDKIDEEIFKDVQDQLSKVPDVETGGLRLSFVENEQELLKDILSSDSNVIKNVIGKTDMILGSNYQRLLKARPGIIREFKEALKVTMQLYYSLGEAISQGNRRKERSIRSAIHSHTSRLTSSFRSGGETKNLFHEPSKHNLLKLYDETRDAINGVEGEQRLKAYIEKNATNVFLSSGWEEDLKELYAGNEELAAQKIKFVRDAAVFLAENRKFSEYIRGNVVFESLTDRNEMNANSTFRKARLAYIMKFIRDMNKMIHPSFNEETGEGPSLDIFRMPSSSQIESFYQESRKSVESAE
jgi:hypothetical protein